MASLLRHIKELKKLNGVGWRILNNSYIKSEAIQCTGVTLKQYHCSILPCAYRGYATFALPKTSEVSSGSNYNYELQIQSLENQLRKFGRISKVDIEKLLHRIQLIENVTSLEALLLIQSCGRPMVDADSKESIKLVQEIWESLERFNIMMDVSHYNALLSVYVEKNHPFDPQEVLEKMASKSIEPNRVTYQNLIAGYCSSGDIGGATKILALMQEKGIPLCENVFNSLIIGHAQAKDLESAVNILKTMENAQVAPSADTYLALLTAYIKNGDIESFTKTLNKLKGSDIQLLDFHLLEITHQLAANGYVKEAEEFISRIPKEYLSDTEVYRVLIQLINLQMPSLALKIIFNSSDDPNRQRVRSSFMIKTIVKAKNLSHEEILSVCEQIAENISIDYAYSRTVYNCLVNNVDPMLTLKVMKKWKENDGEIRDHYFWPLIVNQAKNNNYDEMLSIIQSMNDDFQIKPSNATLRDYIIPYTFGTWDIIIEKLESLNIPRRDILVAIVDRLLMDRKLKSAVSVASNYPVGYPPQILPQAVVALNAREKPELFTYILRLISEDPNNYDPNKMPVSIVDESLKEVMKNIPSFRFLLIGNLLNEYVKAGLTISPEMGDELKAFLNQNMTPEMSEAINKLTSGELTLVPLEEYVKTLEDVVNLQVGANMPDLIELRKSFAECIEEKNVSKLVDILKQMESVNYKSVAVYAQAINLFCEEGMVKEAEMCMNEVKKMPESSLDAGKLLKYAELLIKNNRFVDAMAFLNEQQTVDNTVKMSRSITAISRSLLNTATEQESLSNVRELINLLKSKNFINLDNYTLGVTIKKYIDDNDLKGALEEFEKIYNDYQVTPYKNKLTVELILAEDANSLQKLTDICTKIYSESNALVDLAFNFLICDKVKQAKKILDTPGLKVFNKKLSSTVDYFIRNDKYDNIKYIPQVTKNTLMIDRGYMYETCLNAYIDKNDWQRGLALWTEMQENNVLPTNEFLFKLNKLLKQNNQPVPFAVDDTSNYNDDLSVDNTSQKINDSFSRAIESKNYDLAEDIIRKESMNTKDNVVKFNRLIKSLTLNKRLDKAYLLTQEVLEKRYDIRPSTILKLIDNLIELNKYDEIIQLGNLLTEHSKTQIKYYKTLSKVNIRKYGLKNYIQNFDLNEFADDSAIERRIHFGELAHNLMNNPNELDDFKIWADKLEQKRITRGKDVLWNYYLANNDEAKADQLWNEYISVKSAPLIRPIIEIASARNDLDLLLKLQMKFASHQSLSLNTKAYFASAMINCYTDLGQFQKGLEVIQECSKQFRLELLQPSALRKLRNAMEKNGQEFPYKILEDESNNRNRVTDMEVKSASRL